jgi:hypothetical protein
VTTGPPAQEHFKQTHHPDLGQPDARELALAQVNEMHRRPFSAPDGPGCFFSAADATPNLADLPELFKTKIFEISQQPIRHKKRPTTRTVRIGCWEISNIFG